MLLISTSGFYAQKDQSKIIRPIYLGVVDEIQSEKLSEKRELNIYLPEGYNAQDSIKYPVIYLLDGSLNEDFIHIVGLVQFSSFEWVNQIPKSIVVGVSTIDRRRDYTFPTKVQSEKERFPSSGHSEKFISFIEEELQPFVEKKYNTNQEKTIIGQSLGGLLLTEILLEKPYLFNKYIIISPSLWWSNGAILQKNINKNYSEKIKVYIGVGKEGLTPSVAPRVMEVDANLLSDKLKGMKNKNIQVYFDYLPEENHATIMHQAVLNSFRLFSK